MRIPLMLLKTPEDYYKFLGAVARASNHGIITSFGVFASIGFDGNINHKYPSKEYDFLNDVKDHPDLNMVIGVHGYYSSHPKDVNDGQCRHCLAAYARRTIRIDTHREYFPNLKWNVLRSLHSKVAVFWNGDKAIAIVGSRNFTNSPNHELSIVVQGDEALAVREYAQSLQEMSEPVDQGKLMEFLIEETGSDYCMQIMCGDG